MTNRYRSFMFVIASLLLFVMLVSPFFGAKVRAQDTAPGSSSGVAPSQPAEAFQSSLVPGASRLAYHTQTGQVRFIGTQPGQVIPQPSQLPPDTGPEAAALNFLEAYGGLFGLKDPANELSVMTVEQVEDGRSFVRFQQVYQGVPVLGGELIVQMDAKQNVLSANGEVLPESTLSVVPGVEAAAGASEAKAVVAKTYNLPVENLTTTEPVLWVYNPLLLGAPGIQTDSLVWRIDVTPTDLQPVRELVLVDAHKGRVTLHFNQIDSSMNRVIYNNSNDYTRGLPGTTIARSEGGSATGNSDVDRAYDYSGNTYDFYSTKHGRDSLDGLGMTMISTVNYCPNSSSCPYENAFWNGVQMVYGQGFAAADDVVAHELTHGITENESNLFYYMQSGAINESFSDIWGEFVDLSYDGAYDNDTSGVRWQMGEDVPGFGAIRDMSNPPAFGDPDKMSSANYYCGSADNGGVHWNSGVSNKVAYLMTDGGVFNGYTVTGIGIDKVARIYYEVQSHMLTSAADFQDLAESLSQACNNLIGTSGITQANCAQVREAIAAVEMTRQPASCAANEAPVCDNYGFNSSFNSSLSGWAPTSGAWLYNATYAYTNGVANTFSTLASDNSYADFEYTVMIRRFGCQTCANGVIIRGTPTPLQVYNRWNTDYAFLYTRDGAVSIWKRVGASETQLLGWTASEAVNTGDNWNTVKVISRGNRFFYYLNDDLVWSGTDTGYTYGKVGLTMFRTASSTGDLLEVDSATLAGGTPLPLFYDSFEHGLELWSHTATTGLDQWSHNTSYATSGTYELYGWDQGSVSDFNVRMKNPVNLPAGQNAFLRFRHAYEFEGTTTAYDGGVIEYSTNNGSTWNDSGPLIVNYGYNKTLSASNPLGSRSAFGASSNGYSSTRLNLTSLGGSPFLFRFRIGTDSSVSDLGWLIDEVKIYTCMERGESVYLPMLMHSEPATGFNSQFTDSNSGWRSHAGAWLVNGGTMGTEGIPNSLATASYWQTFANLDYSVRVDRGGCSNCGNGVIVRGEVEPQHADHAWDSFYMFLYSNTGSASVLKSVDGGTSVVLYPWTSSAAIVQGGFNTIRVVATGSGLSYYINGVLIWSGSDASLANGSVGLVMYRDSYSADNWFDVDYATLTGGTARLSQDLLVPEQPVVSSDAYPADAGVLYMSPSR